MTTAERPRLRSIDGGASTGAAARTAEPYGLAEGFEAATVTALCSRASLWARLGSSVAPECLTSPVAALALKAAKEFAADVGKGPGSLLVVLQRLSRWRDAGKLAQDKLEAVSEFFDAAEDAGLPTDDAIIAEIAPVLQQRAKQAAIQLALEDYKRGDDMVRVEKALAQARSIGKVADADGSILGGASFEAIDALRLMERVASGIGELDLLLDGGFPRGLTLFVGGPGAGKSMALTQCAAEGVYQGLHVGIVTLELPEEVQLARVIANLTATPINDLLQGRQQRAKNRMTELLPSLGSLTTRYFSPKATTCDEIFRWVDQREQKVGRAMDLLVVDYLDKLGSGSEDSSYKAQGDVADTLRDFALSRKIFCLSASQARRASGKSGKQGGPVQTDLDDIADSMGKPRVADLVLTLRKDDDSQGLDMFVAKNRLGKSRTSTGPLSQDETCGRLVAVSRTCGW